MKKSLTFAEYVFRLYMQKGTECPEMHNLIYLLGVEKVEAALKKAQDEYNSMPEYKRKTYYEIEK